ncbi:hypothetical protein [Microbacterium sp. C7(2022)]|uniref:hypothetical protein n=1 Tax=Microbacterium sp. C7(2022) TaxID=2992759 RepID=UPI00237BC4D9|nr:hypothetical protein [Microbacterium sp. C7(2022)]MDE0547480.1 hypothetical protein [Microbacterium sp. C7(2022)]
MTSLREQLGGGRETPEFRMLLPAGWTLNDTSVETEQRLLREARSRLREAHLPDAYASLSENVRAALERARTQGAFVLIMPGDVAPDWATVPVSVLGSITTGRPDASLDELVADAVERRGAVALDGSRLFLRWAERRTAEVSGEKVGVYTVVYLTPVPGSKRTKALQFTAVLAHDPAVDPETDVQIQAWLAMLDASIVTFGWTDQ